MKRYDCHVGEYFERPDGEFVLYEDHAKALSARLQDLEEAREGRAAAIDRLTPLGCENAELRAALERITECIEYRDGREGVQVIEGSSRDFWIAIREAKRITHTHESSGVPQEPEHT